MYEDPLKDLCQVFRGGSSYTRFLIREHSKQETPPGGGVSFNQLVLSGLLQAKDNFKKSTESCFPLMEEDISRQILHSFFADGEIELLAKKLLCPDSKCLILSLSNPFLQVFV